MNFKDIIKPLLISLSIVVCIAFFFAFYFPILVNASVIDIDFEDYNLGEIIGQDDWTFQSGHLTSSSTINFGFGNYTSYPQVLYMKNASYSKAIERKHATTTDFLVCSDIYISQASSTIYLHFQYQQGLNPYLENGSIYFINNGDIGVTNSGAIDYIGNWQFNEFETVCVNWTASTNQVRYYINDTWSSFYTSPEVSSYNNLMQIVGSANTEYIVDSINNSTYYNNDVEIIDLPVSTSTVEIINEFNVPNNQICYADDDECYINFTYDRNVHELSNFYIIPNVTGQKFPEYAVATTVIDFDYSGYGQIEMQCDTPDDDSLNYCAWLDYGGGSMICNLDFACYDFTASSTVYGEAQRVRNQFTSLVSSWETVFPINIIVSLKNSMNEVTVSSTTGIMPIRIDGNIIGYWIEKDGIRNFLGETVFTLIQTMLTILLYSSVVVYMFFRIKRINQSNNYED